MSIVRNSSLIVAGTVASATFGILQSAYVVRTLQSELFGKLVLLQTTWQTLILLTNFGTQSNGMYRMAASVGSADREMAAESLSYLLKGVFLSSALAGAAAVGSSFFLPGYVGLGSETSLAFSLMGILAVFSVPQVCTMAIVQANRRMGLFTGLLVVNAAILATSTIALTYFFGIFGALIAPSTAAVISAPWYISFVRKDPSASEGLIALLRRKALRQNFMDGVWMAIDKGVAGFYSVVPYHLVNSIYGPSVTGSLRIATRLCELSAIPQNAITTNSQSLMPVEWARGDAKGAWKVFWKNVTIGGGVAVFFSVALLLFGREILWLVYGRPGASSAYMIPALVPYILITALGPMGIMYRLLNLVPRVALSRGVLLLSTAAGLYWILPASDPSFAGLAASSFHVVPAAFVFWMILRRKNVDADKKTVALPDVRTLDAE